MAINDPLRDRPQHRYHRSRGSRAGLLAEDEWELESHWAGLFEVHGKKMPGHQWVLVVPKWKLEAAEARIRELEAAGNDRV